MAMPVMVMAVPVMVMMMAVMTMAMASSVVAVASSKVPVASSVPAMAAVTAAASESPAWNGQRGSRQRQSSDRGCNDFLDPGHACLLSCAIRGLLCPDPT
jgi:hypothetical protein